MTQKHNTYVRTLSPTNHSTTTDYEKKCIDSTDCPVNPEKPDVPLNKNDAFQKVQKRRVQEKR